MERLRGLKQTFTGLASFIQLGPEVPRNLTLKGSRTINYACNTHNSRAVGLGTIRGLSAAVDAYFATKNGRVIIVPPVRCIESQASINGRIWPLQTFCEYSCAWSTNNRINRTGGHRRRQPQTLHLFVGVLHLFIEVTSKVLKRSRSSTRNNETVLFAQIKPLFRSSRIPQRHPNGMYTTAEGDIAENELADHMHIIPAYQLHTYLHKVTTSESVQHQPAPNTPVVFIPIADAFPVP